MSIINTNSYQDGDNIGWYQHTDDTETPSVEWYNHQQAIGLDDRYDYRPYPYMLINGIAIPEGVAGKQVAEWLFSGQMVGCHPRTYISGQGWSNPSDFFSLAYLDLINRQFVYGRYTPPLSPRINTKNIDPRAKWNWIHTSLNGVIHRYSHVFDGLAMWGGEVWSYQFCKVYTMEELNGKFEAIRD